MLNPWTITGFTDGEGCFTLYVRKDKQKRKNSVVTYYRWQVDFAFSLRGDDIEMLEKIKEYFDCGTVALSRKSDSASMHGYGQCGYHVLVPNDLINKVIPHFQKYSLQSKKQRDFEIWKKAVIIIKNAKERKKSLFDKVVYTDEENKNLVEILEELKKRVTGGHVTQKRVNHLLQGTKEIIKKI